MPHAKWKFRKGPKTLKILSQIGEFSPNLVTLTACDLDNFIHLNNLSIAPNEGLKGLCLGN